MSSQRQKIDPTVLTAFPLPFPFRESDALRGSVRRGRPFGSEVVQEGAVRISGAMIELPLGEPRSCLA